jgi:hypothetical protein
MRQYIALVLKRYDVKNDIIISGGAKGVDSLAVEIAEALRFQVIIYHPDKQEWKYFRQRNLRIADECDELHCFTIPVKTEKCYHHDTPMEHEKTAGCWTACKAFEQDKSCQLIVIPNRESTQQKFG